MLNIVDSVGVNSPRLLDIRLLLEVLCQIHFIRVVESFSLLNLIDHRDVLLVSVFNKEGITLPLVIHGLMQRHKD